MRWATAVSAAPRRAKGHSGAPWAPPAANSRLARAAHWAALRNGSAAAARWSANPAAARSRRASAASGRSDDTSKAWPPPVVRNESASRVTSSSSERPASMSCWSIARASASRRPVGRPDGPDRLLVPELERHRHQLVDPARPPVGELHMPPGEAAGAGVGGHAGRLGGMPAGIEGGGVGGRAVVEGLDVEAAEPAFGRFGEAEEVGQGEVGGHPGGVDPGRGDLGAPDAPPVALVEALRLPQRRRAAPARVTARRPRPEGRRPGRRSGGPARSRGRPGRRRTSRTTCTSAWRCAGPRAA